jgi:FKBP-type peptidyl-prolyl cis-trans isomerase 2
MAENKMAEVAKLFGKKLGEEFTVKVPQYDEYGEVKQYQNVKGYFCGRGFRSEQINFADAFIFAELLEGYAVIVDE